MQAKDGHATLLWRPAGKGSPTPPARLGAQQLAAATAAPAAGSTESASAAAVQQYSFLSVYAFTYKLMPKSSTQASAPSWSGWKRTLRTVACCSHGCPAGCVSAAKRSPRSSTPVPGEKQNRVLRWHDLEQPCIDHLTGTGAALQPRSPLAHQFRCCVGHDHLVGTGATLRPWQARR